MTDTPWQEREGSEQEHGEETVHSEEKWVLRRRGRACKENLLRRSTRSIKKTADGRRHRSRKIIDKNNKKNNLRDFEVGVGLKCRGELNMKRRGG